MAEAQTRTQITAADTWTAVTVPVGAGDFVLGLEDPNATFRISVDNALNPTTQGMFIDKTGQYAHEGVNTDFLTLYISASATTFAILQYNN